MQKKLWEREYRENRNWPSSYRTEPSKALVEFFEDRYKVSGPVLDVGSGFGRNSIYLAKKGYEVVGIDMVGYAIEVARKRVKKEGVLDKITFLEQSMADRIPYGDGHFGLVVDMMSMHLLNEAERRAYGKEVVRLIKPGGYFVFYTIAADSPEAQRLIKESPGGEPNSYLIPQNGMVEHAFDKEEINNLFAPLAFKKFRSVRDKTEFKGKVYEREYCSGVMEK